jgi:Skp family chaperone for outer membrane proteins
MRNKLVILGCLISLVIFAAGDKMTWAKSKPTVKTGIISMRKIFQDCKRNIKYRETTTAEQDQIMAELEKLSKEIEVEKLGLRTLKTDSEDYLTAVKGLLTKQAKLQAQQEFYKQHLELKDQKWTEKLYKDILKTTGEIAEAKGFELVLEQEEPELPASSANDLMMTIRTYKVIYSGGCENITEEVISKINAADEVAGTINTKSNTKSNIKSTSKSDVNSTPGVKK